MTTVPEASLEALAAHGRESVKETRQELELAVRRLVNGNPRQVPKGTKLTAASVCKEAGVVLTGAGASFPHGVDPEDENIRISPTFPTEEELQKAMDVFVCAAKLAAAEQALAK